MVPVPKVPGLVSQAPGLSPAPTRHPEPRPALYPDRWPGAQGAPGRPGGLLWGQAGRSAGYARVSVLGPLQGLGGLALRYLLTELRACVCVS